MGQNGDKTHKKNYEFNNNKYCQQLKVTVLASGLASR
jgi:hypothetical protein